MTDTRISRIICFEKDWGFSQEEREKLCTSYQLEFIDVDNCSIKHNAILCGIVKSELDRSQAIFYKNGTVFEEKDRAKNPLQRKSMILDGVTRQENIDKYNIVAVFLGKDQLPTKRKMKDIIPIMHQCIAGCRHPAPIYDIKVNEIDLREGEGSRAENRRNQRKALIKKQVTIIISKYFDISSYYDDTVKKVEIMDLFKKINSDLFVRVNGKNVILNRAGEVLAPEVIEMRAMQIEKGKLYTSEGLKNYLKRKDRRFFT